jgi:hypothetical protein
MVRDTVDRSGRADVIYGVGACGTRCSHRIAASAADLERVTGTVDTRAAVRSLAKVFGATVAQWERTGWTGESSAPVAKFRPAS